MNSTQLGRYQLTDKLALGGTAEIFKAKLLGVEGFEKTVVIKRILPHWSSNHNFISMLIDEAKIMVKLSHERIVQVYELGKEEDNYYIAMEYVHGVDLKRLRDWLTRNKTKLSLAEVVHITIEVLRGIDYIHRQKDEEGKNLQIVHRDISPQNILISIEGTLKITDFGIAHAASRSYETATGVLKGKFAYMSPEQAQGSLLDQRTDIFALGIIFYELLSGQRMLSGRSDLQVLEQVKNFNVDRFPLQWPDDKELCHIIRRALESDLKKRYATAQEFLKDLIEYRTRHGLFIDSDSIAEKVFQALESRSHENKKQNTIPQKQILAQSANFQQAATQADGEATRFLDETLSYPIALERTNTLVEADLEKIIPKAAKKIEPSTALKNHAPISQKQKNNSWPKVLASSFLFFIFLFLGLFVYTNFFKTEKKSTLAPKPAETLPVSQIISESSESKLSVVEPSKKQETEMESKRKKEEPKKLKENKKDLIAKEKSSADLPEKESAPPKGKGLLSVKANPWGKISVSGVVSGSERPVASNVAYGNYSISVAYKGLSGNWKTLSRNVRVAKASTSCIANFRPDGEGSLSCR
ncbi:MAG: serine/threonine protein kinase [Deltaproteobacteria bacterium]|nr:serine/threonine protein kinase [Deltaproteobacteria bacterium]